MMPQYLKAKGESLASNGYFVVPIRPGEKRPRGAAWEQFRADSAQIKKWCSNGSANDGVGILAFNTPAADIDVMDVAVSGAMMDAIDALFPGYALQTRVGLAPKFLVPFRTDTPFGKITSNVYTDGTHDHKVEILADGQQWVAYHEHPDTRKPYEWFDGLSDAGISAVARESLPVLDTALARKIVETFEILAAERVSSGAWSVKTRAASVKNNDAARANDDFGPHTPPVADLSRGQIEALIHKLDFDSRDQWVRAGRILHHQFDGEQEGFDIWEAWSANSTKYDAANQVTVWESFGHRSDSPETIRGLIKEFGQPEKAQEPIGEEFVPAARFASEQKVEWHIKHVLPKRGLIVVYGAPGSSKSFFALDMVAHVARGLPWRGHRVKQSKIAYVAAEGVAGFGSRLAAYSKGHGVSLDDVPVFVRGGSLVLKTQVLALCESIQKIGGVGIVVIDTLSAVTPGENENVSEGMGLAVNAANLIIESTGASVILIHHTNKTGEMRGWSGLLGAADNSIRIERKDDVRTAHIEKQKEGKDSAEYGYKLRVIDLYEDGDGDMVTSCVVEESEEIAKKPDGRRERMSTGGDFATSEKYSKARHYLSIIQQEVGLEGANIDEADVIHAIQADETVNPLKEQDHPKASNIKRTLLALADKGKIKREGRWIRLTL